MPPFCYRMPVRFSDIDHAGIVYFARFFHFAHLALEEFFLFRVGGRAYADLIDKERIGFPSVETACRFVAPLTFGDMAEIELEIAKLGRSSIQFRFRVYRGPRSEPSDPASSSSTRAWLASGSGTETRSEPDSESVTPGSAEPGDAHGARVLCAEGRYVVAVVDLDRFRAVPIPETLQRIVEPLVIPSSGDTPAD